MKGKRQMKFFRREATVHEDALESKIAKIVNVCEEKISDQFKHESTAGYGDDYNDGRIVGQAALSRRILEIIKGQIK